MILPLFILENLGTPELLLIGIAALIFLGPRRLPEMAKKAGKMMNDLRSATNDFKETWEKEINFEEEAKAFDLNAIENESSIARTSNVGVPGSDRTPTSEAETEAINSETTGRAIPDPVIRDLDPNTILPPSDIDNSNIQPPTVSNDPLDKSNWL